MGRKKGAPHPVQISASSNIPATVECAPFSMKCQRVFAHLYDDALKRPRIQGLLEDSLMRR